MTHPEGKPTQLAVWYFIAATFIFAAPSFFYENLPAWMRIGLFIVGLIVVAAGGWQLARELRRPKVERDLPPTS
ncbi:hypothetical protein ACTU3I_14815 [Microbacterium sp. RD1]|uniref:hypothetical protein n=1 Tax=Microbacterium sp. RD1 TaxID=3457313 RepID=UPI003FA60E82